MATMRTVYNTYDTAVLDVTTIKKGIIIHGVNCQGVMGSGIAGALARKWPVVRTEYLQMVEMWREQQAPHFVSNVMLGVVQPVLVDVSLTVFNCFTQDYFGSDGKRYASPEAIRAALTKVFDGLDGIVNTILDLADDESVQLAVKESSRVYMPQIGCGLGGLSWDADVKPIVDELYVDRMFPLTIVTL